MGQHPQRPTTAACSSTAQQPIKHPGNDGWSTPPTTAPSRCRSAEFTREIDINPLDDDGTGTVNPTLREVRVVVRYKVYGAWRNYVMITYVSSYS